MSFIYSLINNCNALATNPDNRNNLDRYQKSFYLEFLSIAFRLDPKYRHFENAGRLFANIGWNKRSCDGKETHLPMLTAWYYWKSETKIQPANKNDISWNDITPARDWHSNLCTETSYNNRFDWIEPHRIINSKNDIDSYKQEVFELFKLDLETTTDNSSGDGGTKYNTPPVLLDRSVASNFIYAIHAFIGTIDEVKSRTNTANDEGIRKDILTFTIRLIALNNECARIIIILDRLSNEPFDQKKNSETEKELSLAIQKAIRIHHFIAQYFYDCQRSDRKMLDVLELMVRDVVRSGYQWHYGSEIYFGNIKFDHESEHELATNLKDIRYYEDFKQANDLLSSVVGDLRAFIKNSFAAEEVIKLTRQIHANDEKSEMYHFGDY